MEHPGRAGVFELTCPVCKTKHQFRFSEPKKPEIKVETEKKEVIRLTLDFEVDRIYSIACPHCQEHKIEFEPEKTGNYTLKCPKCGGLSLAQVIEKTKSIYNTSDPLMGKGKLEHIRGHFLPNREYILEAGTYIIGRYDEDVNSDIAIKNDMAMSRRSVQIQVTNTFGNYSYILKVLKSTNPVLHNGKPLVVGSEILLGFGDEIVLGKTKFRFTKA
jgi:phage FluMu protein Com